MTKQIIVGFDGTHSASAAVDWAIREAEALGAELQIVSCYSIPPAAASMSGFGYGEALQVVREQAQTTLDTCAASVRAAHPHLPITTRLAVGAAAPSLLEGADPNDLVVVGASHHEGAAAVWLGSTPRALIRHPQCPVVVVRGTGRCVGGARAHAADGTRGIASKPHAPPVSGAVGQPVSGSAS